MNTALRFALYALPLAALACEDAKPASTTASATATVAVVATAASVATTAVAVAKAPVLPAAAYDIDPPHTKVGFSVKHMMVSTTHGEFKTFTGKVNVDQNDLSKMSVVVDIDTTSIDTADKKRDAHLNSPDFFDTKKFPKMSFKSTKVEADGEGYKIAGDLTIRDVTKSVTLKVDPLTAEIKDPYGFLRRGTHASTALSRKEFGLVWNAALEAGGVAVSDEVKLDLDIELVRKAEAASAASGAASAAPAMSASAPAKK